MTSSPASGASKYNIIPDNNTLWDNFTSLGPNDVFIGRLRLKETEEALLLDLIERGVTLFPSALTQVLSRSKTLQARVFAEYMAPDTSAVHDRNDLLAIMPEYQRGGYTKLVTKQDRANGGMGINLWTSIEDIFNLATLAGFPFPFVIQPFHEDCHDIRVVVLGDYLEAYRRNNPNNFRNNLHFGGTSEPVCLSEEQLDLCKSVMERGKFPYAHIDLMVTGKKQTYLAEINLRGGIRGARITPAEYQRKIDEIHSQFSLDLNR